MTSDLIRRRFLDFFAGKGHKVVPSDSLLPRDDATLLFTGAGMNQFKEQFMGRNIETPRAVSCQKCLRTGDIEKVGRTPRHHTFFEMLGNFSFGDYFKEEAILWAWEFMTGELSLSAERLHVSVYEKDEEARAIWLKKVRLPEERITRLGTKDNFWPADAPSKGPNGPCGPCSELFYDRGAECGCGKASCGVACDCGRFVEVWNLVFTEFERCEDGTLVELPNRNIDTGMGLERIASVVQNTPSNFGTDLLAPLVSKAGEIIGGFAPDEREKLDLIADHIRAIVFAISDGVAPSNERRGYVIRKLIRRAYMAGRGDSPFLYRLVPTVVALMKGAYPETADKREHVAAIVEQEERKFGDTLRSSLPLLDEMLQRPCGVLTGADIFKLVDTYGLPLEVIAQRSASAGKELDIRGYEEFMAERKESSRRGSDISCDRIFQADAFENAPVPESSEEMPLVSRLSYIVSCGERVESVREGDTAEVVLSPQSALFYPEAGGQVGDKGYIEKPDGRMEVFNTYETGGRKVLLAEVIEGVFKQEDEVVLYSDHERKRRIAANHSATHLLQAALRSVLGEHVKQSGSLVDEDRLRFDFLHMKKLTPRQLNEVESLVNEWINEGICVTRRHMGLEQARDMGALSFFGERYPDTVRVVSMEGVSMELCGGTHVDCTREIGLFRIMSESSVASGIRRIEALTGRRAEEAVTADIKGLLDRIDELSEAGGRGGDAVLEDARVMAESVTAIDPGKLKDMNERILPHLERCRSELERSRKKEHKAREKESYEELKRSLDDVSENAELIGGVKVYSASLSEAGMDLLRRAAGHLQSKVPSGVIILGAELSGKAFLICTVSEDIAARGVSANALIDIGAKGIGGRGGGRDTFAQAGGDEPAALEKAILDMKSSIKIGER